MRVEQALSHIHAAGACVLQRDNVRDTDVIHRHAAAQRRRSHRRKDQSDDDQHDPGMAPLHHHFELSGWKETQVVVRFWIISMMLVLIGLSTLKIR